VKILAFLVLLFAAAESPAQVKIFGYWWENPLSYQATPQGLDSLSARKCGVCHQEIYREWHASAHAHALSDLQFQAEMKKSPEVGWLCLNCHTPLENQIERIAVSVRNRLTHQPVFRTNARFDRELHEDAVTCAVCHVRGAASGTPGSPSTHGRHLHHVPSGHCRIHRHAGVYIRYRRRVEKWAVCRAQ